MSNEYEALLDATVEHLRTLKAQGVQHVSVEVETLQQLANPAAPAPISLSPREARGGRSQNYTVDDRIAVGPERGAIQKTPLPNPLLTPASRGEGEEVGSNASKNGSTFSSGEPLSAEAKEAAMIDLRCRAMQCVKCPHLVSSRKNVVFGVGNIHTDLMFVGEAPGADEDQQGEPFVGKAGQLLTKIIQTMGESRQTVYIANILKCRPDTPGQAYGNRKPTPMEMATCLPYLLAQVDIIRPKVIVALGATAMEGLFNQPMGIMKIRGHWHTFRDIPVMPTYHPAYLLRNQAMTEKRKVWEDMLQVMEKLGRTISEKQRSYFLKAA